MSAPDALMVLRAEGVRLATAELGDGRLERWPDEAWQGLVEQPTRRIDLTELTRVMADLTQAFARYDTRMDGTAAERLHRCLQLTRREASDVRLWRFLAIIAYPNVVRHRWEHHSASTMRARFIRAGTRPDSNAFSRWWWIAELTRQGDHYGLTHRAFARAPLTNAVFVRSLSFFRPAVEACLTVLEHEPADAVERVMFELSRWLALVPLEGLSRADLEDRLKVCLRQAR